MPYPYQRISSLGAVPALVDLDRAAIRILHDNTATPGHDFVSADGPRLCGRAHGRPGRAFGPRGGPGRPRTAQGGCMTRRAQPP